MSFGEWLAMLVLVAEHYSGSQEILRFYFILSLSARVEISENSLKGDNMDKAAPGFGLCGASSLRALECHAFVYLAQGMCLPTLSTSVSSMGSACQWHLINVKK